MPLPVEGDHDTGGFWEAARRHELVVKACVACGTVLHAPVSFCGECGSWETHWKQVSGRGSVYSWMIVEHRTHPAFEVPYSVVLVQLDDAPVRLLGYFPGRVEFEAGQPMKVRFEAADDGTVLPQWEPV
jgi:uncharacterized OB-fold protein